MTIHALSSLQLVLLLGVSLGWLTLMYLLRRPPREMKVSSVLLWQRVLERRKRRPPDYLRRLLSWLLFALVIAAGLLAIADPEFPAWWRGRRHLQIVVENGPAMLAADSLRASRWERAREQIRRLLEQEPAGSRILLEETRGPGRALRFTSPAEALEELGRLEIAYSSPRRPLKRNPEAEEVLLFSDGREERPLPDSVQRILLPASPENVALESLAVIPSFPPRARLKVHNQTARMRDVEIVFSDSAGESLRRKVHLEAEGRSQVEVEMEAFSPGPIRATLSPGDGFPLDDARFEWLPRARRRILLAGDRSRTLETALSSYPNLDVRMVGRELSREEEGDALILVNWAPQTAPAIPVLLIGAPEAPWLPRVTGVVKGIEELQWLRGHFLTAGLGGSDLQVSRAWKIAPEGAEILAWSREAPLLLFWPGGSSRLQLAFRIEDSNLAGLPAFPILLDNFLNWASTRGLRHAPLGGFGLEAGSRAWGPEGVELPVRHEEGRDEIRLDRPGVYSAITPSGRLQIVANAPPVEVVSGDDSEPGGAAERWVGEESSVSWWKLLLTCAAILMLAEWGLFHRRLTV